MNTITQAKYLCKPSYWFLPRLTCCGLLAFLIMCHAVPAQASLFKGETLDKVANVLSWVVLVIVPIVGIVLFWLVHILPEKIAEKKKHPQVKAIQTLCLLSLFFGGLLWPLAWLWAYTKPVLYKMSYGTDEVEPEHGSRKEAAATAEELTEIQRLKAQLAELETKLAVQVAETKGGQI
jgi:CBS domain containing-hemolysin-like protein